MRLTPRHLAAYATPRKGTRDSLVALRHMVLSCLLAYAKRASEGGAL